MDAGAAGAAAGNNQVLETMGESSGPKSPEGKARIGRNGWNGGTRVLLRELSRVLRGQRDRLKEPSFD